MRAFIVVLLLTACATAMADVPHQISYQGRLLDSHGEPFTGDADISFAIYADSSTSTMLWKENYYGVLVADGLFNLMLGSISPLDPSVFNGSVRYLQLTVDGDPSDDMIPVTSVPHAYRAIKSDTAQYAHTAGATGGSAWVDDGGTVRLANINDSVGIGTADPLVKFQVEADVTAILGSSHGSGTAFGVFGSNDSDGTGVLGSSTSGSGVHGISFFGYGGYFFGPKTYISHNLGIGIEEPSERVHVYTEESGERAFMKIESMHPSNWDEAGLRIETPDNRWHWRMDDDSYNQLQPGAISLRSQSAGKEVMTWNANGDVGINNTNPAYRLDVTGNTRVTGDFSVDGQIFANSIVGNYASNSINKNDIHDEVGFATAGSAPYSNMPTSWSAYVTKEITVPTAGRILAIGSARVYADHGFSGRSSAHVAISNVPNNSSGVFYSLWSLDEQADIGGYANTVPLYNVFDVGSAGTYTYYIVAYRDSDNDMDLQSAQMSLIFIPTDYAATTVAAASAGDRSLAEPVIAPASHSTENSYETMAARIDELERRLSELESR